MRLRRGGWVVLGFTVFTLSCSTEEKGTDAGYGSDSFTDQGSPGRAFTPLYESYFYRCASCHAENAWGSVTGIEKSLDFSTEDRAYETMKYGSATGLVGNVEACNGVRFITSSYETSLIAAVLDEDVRASFSDASHPGCDGDAITDMTVKVGVEPPAGFLSRLREWIEAGAPR